jgi:nucleoside permease NupC
VVFAGKWWIPVLVLPVLFVLWFSVTLSNVLLASHLGVQLSGYLTEIASLVVRLSYAGSLFAPFAVYHDRKYVSEQSAWTPTVLYLLVFVPLLNVLISVIYLVRRHRFVGIP